jgi:hypothetical protein
MAAKSKIVNAPNSDQSPEAKLMKALELMYSGKAEAEQAFEAVAKEAESNENVALARTARNYGLVLRHRRASRPEVAVEADLEASVLINQKAWESALTVLNGALRSDSSKGHLHYLKAMVLAQSSPDEAASVLKTAVSMDKTLLYLYQMEPDFNPVRRHPAFVEFETA